MSTIRKQDTDGTKSTLGVGEFGFDNYPSGGDQGRVYIGDGSSNIPLSRKDEVESFKEDFNERTEAVNALLGVSDTTYRYDKLLGALDVIGMNYTDGNLSAVRYTGDDGTVTFFRDVMTYTDGNLVKVEHFYDVEALTTPSGQTVLTYDGSGNLIAAAYTE